MKVDEVVIEELAILLEDAKITQEFFTPVLNKLLTQIWLIGLEAGVNNSLITVRGEGRVIQLTAHELVELANGL